MPNLKNITEVFNKVRSSMIYKSDQDVFGKLEYWKSWKDEIAQGKKFLYDDCDGFALTMAEMLVEAGFERKDVAICFCSIQVQSSSQEEYHLLCKVRNPEDDIWYVIDNNVTKPLKRNGAGGPGWKFKYISCMYAGKPGQWVEDV